MVKYRKVDSLISHKNNLETIAKLKLKNKRLEEEIKVNKKIIEGLEKSGYSISALKAKLRKRLE